MTVKEVSQVRKRLLILQSDVRLFLETFYELQQTARFDGRSTHACRECGQHFLGLHIPDMLTHSLRHYPA